MPLLSRILKRADTCAASIFSSPFYKPCPASSSTLTHGTLLNAYIAHLKPRSISRTTSTRANRNPVLTRSISPNETSSRSSKMATTNLSSEDSTSCSSPIFTRLPTRESPLTSPEASVFDVKDVDDALVDALTKDLDLEEICQLLIDVARKAGDMILAADPSIDDSETKNNTSDRVTATDKAVEAMVYSTLSAAYPEFDFLGEETFKEGQKLSDAPTFVCDPIDGTLNFIHGFPNVAVSLALTVARQPVIGVVFNPFRRDLFTAIKGRGAHFTRFDGRRSTLPVRSHPSSLGSLNDCLVAVEWGNQRSGPNWALRSSVHKKMLSARDQGGAMVHSVRSSGSAALDFCYVAAGWIDVFWEAGVWIWDICAGWIILCEAGGIVASANPGGWNPELEGRLYLAVRGAPAGQKEVVEELWGLMEGKKFEFPAVPVKK